MRIMKRNPVKNSHVLLWLARLKDRRKKIIEQLHLKGRVEVEKPNLDGVLGTA